MELKEAIEKALKHYLIHIQIGVHHDGEKKLHRTIQCLNYIENGGNIDKDWIVGKNLLFVDVFNEYSKYLKDEIQNALPDDNEVSKLRTERTTINLLLQGLKQHLGIV